MDELTGVQAKDAQLSRCADAERRMCSDASLHISGTEHCPGSSILLWQPARSSSLAFGTTRDEEDALAHLQRLMGSRYFREAMAHHPG